MRTALLAAVATPGTWFSKTDARGVTTGTTYDVLGRPTLVQYSDSTPSPTRAWDLGAYGIGRLHSVSNAQATSVYTYDEYAANNGTIPGIANHRDRTKDPTFAYDAFYRLTAAETAGSHRGLAWTYDRYGNRLSQTVSKGTGPLEC